MSKVLNVYKNGPDTESPDLTTDSISAAAPAGGGIKTATLPRQGD